MRINFLLLVAIVVCNPIGAQSLAGWLASDEMNWLKSQKLKYTRPEGFRETPVYECFRATDKMLVMMSCSSNQLVSDDGEVIVFMPVRPLLSVQDSIDIKKIFPNSRIGGFNQMHTAIPRMSVVYSHGADSALKWKNYVTYYSSEDAHLKFNADTAISVPINLLKSEYYLEKYQYLTALVLQKQGRGFITLYCFFTSQGYANSKKYMASLEKALRFEDGQ